MGEIWIDYNTFRFLNLLCQLFSFWGLRFRFFIKTFFVPFFIYFDDKFLRVFLVKFTYLGMSWNFHWERFNRLEQIFLEHNFPCPWRIFLSFLHFHDLSGQMLVWNILAFFELTVIMMIISRHIGSFLFQPGNRSSLHLAHPWFFQTDNISSNLSIFLCITTLILDRSFGEIVRRVVELTAVRSFVNLEVNDFFVGINKMLVIVLIFKSIFEGVLLNVSTIVDFFADEGEEISYFFSFRPEVRLNLGKDEHSIDFDLERAMSWEGNELLFDLIVVSLNLHPLGWAPSPMFGIMFRRFVLGDGDIGVDRLSFFGYS